MGWGWSVGVRACGFGVGGCFEPFLQGGRSVLGDDVREGLGLVGWGWSVLVCAFGLGVGGLGVVGRGVCLQVWTSWVGVGQG